MQGEDDPETRDRLVSGQAIKIWKRIKESKLTLQQGKDLCNFNASEVYKNLWKAYCQLIGKLGKGMRLKDIVEYNPGEKAVKFAGTINCLIDEILLQLDRERELMTKRLVDYIVTLDR